MVKSACGIEAVYMCFNGTGIWGGETIFIISKLFEIMTSLYQPITLILNFITCRMV